jgi:hypothetical protein
MKAVGREPSSRAEGTVTTRLDMTTIRPRVNEVVRVLHGLSNIELAGVLAMAMYSMTGPLAPDLCDAVAQVIPQVQKASRQ